MIKIIKLSVFLCCLLIVNIKEFSCNTVNLPEFSDFEEIDVDKILSSDDSLENVPDNGADEIISGSTTIKAVALIRGTTTNGIVHFEQTENGSTRVYGTIQGLSPGGQHGMHVHEYKVNHGDCSTAGEHYNPSNSNHGSPHSDDAHVGDLGNIFANKKGIAEFDIQSDKLSLNGKWSVINRSIVVHFNTDDLGTGRNTESLKNGNSGSKIACGNIKFVTLNKN